MIKLILFNKPFGVHSQFRKDTPQMRTLADFFTDKDLRVAGRLDKDSEGLLLLTNHGGLNHLITTPPKNHHSKKIRKFYLAQVENIPTKEQLNMLRQGVVLKDGLTLPAQVKQLDDDKLPINLWQRNPPIRTRKTIPTAWLMIGICEGKNRQVRRMLAHVGLPCLRLIRCQIGDWQLASLPVGQSRLVQLSQDDLIQLGLNIQSQKRQNFKQFHATKSVRNLRKNISNARVGRKNLVKT